MEVSHWCEAKAVPGMQGCVLVLLIRKIGQKPRLDTETCTAACGGHLQVLQWARSQGCPWNEGTSAGAARGGHLKVIKQLFETSEGLYGTYLL